MRSARQTRHLKLNDVLGLLESVRRTRARYVDDAETDRYLSLAEQPADAANAEELHRFLSEGKTAVDEHALDIGGQGRGDYRQYLVETHTGQADLNTALAYRQLSRELTERSVDLSAQTQKDGHFDVGSRLTDIFGDNEAATELDALVDPSSLADGLLGSAFGQLGGQLGNLFADDGSGKSVWDKLGDFFTPRSPKKQAEEINRRIEESLRQWGENALGGLTGLLTDGLEDLAGSLLPSAELPVDITHSGMRLTTGERIEIQGMALENLCKSMELELEADEKVLQSLERTPHQRKVDEASNSRVLVQSLSRVKL